MQILLLHLFDLRVLEDICVRSRPLFDIKTMESSLSSFLCTEEVEIRLELECRLVQAVTLSRVLLSFKPVTSEDTGRARMNSGPGVGRQRHSSVSSVSSGTGVGRSIFNNAPDSMTSLSSTGRL